MLARMDFRIVLTCILIAGAAVGIASPGGLLSYGASDAAPASSQPTSLSPHSPIRDTGVQDTSAAWSDSAVLAREADGHFYASVMIDGQPFRMLVDTGASVVALTGADAEAMGLSWNESDVRPVAQGASGPVEGVVATLGSVTLGDHEAPDVQAIIIPEGLGISLLGQSFLGTLGSVRISDDQMILEN